MEKWVTRVDSRLFWSMLGAILAAVVALAMSGPWATGSTGHSTPWRHPGEPESRRRRKRKRRDSRPPERRPRRGVPASSPFRGRAPGAHRRARTDGQARNPDRPRLGGASGGRHCRPGARLPKHGGGGHGPRQGRGPVRAHDGRLNRRAIPLTRRRRPVPCSGRGEPHRPAADSQAPRVRPPVGLVPRRGAPSPAVGGAVCDAR